MVSQDNLITIALAVCSLAGVAFTASLGALSHRVGNIKASSERLDQKLTDLLATLPKEYVAKSDFSNKVAGLERQMEKIDEKLDRLSDQLAGGRRTCERDS